MFVFFLFRLSQLKCTSCENLPNARFPHGNQLGLLFSAEAGATFLSASCDG